MSTYTITKASFDDPEQDPDDLKQAYVSELHRNVSRDEIIKLLSENNRVVAHAGAFKAELKLQPESGLAGPYLEAWDGDEQLGSLPLPKLTGP